MSFQDEIGKVIESALAEKHREREEAASFSAEWLRMRDTLVLKLLREAGRAFVDKAGGESHAGPTNGSVRLSLRYMGQEPYLTFSPDPQKKEVICKSSHEDDQEEPFTLENLTEDVVRDKVARFVYQVITGKKWEPSVYDRRGILSF